MLIARQPSTHMRLLALTTAVVTIVAIASLWAGPAGADPALEALRARGSLRVGVKTSAPPFGSFDAAGRPVGFEIDLARLFARVLFDSDTSVQFVPVTTTTRFELLKEGRVDLLIATVTVTDERRSLAELSDPYFMSASLILVRRASKVEQLSDLTGRRIAVVGKSVQQRDVGELEARAFQVEVVSVADGVRAVKSGQADAFVYDDVEVLRIAQVDPELRVTGSPIRARPYAVAARKGDLGLIRWVNGWLARLRRDGSYGDLWRRYFAPYESWLVGS
jgi:ABC-type amino acid transport substrate-binding protein